MPKPTTPLALWASNHVEVAPGSDPAANRVIEPTPALRTEGFGATPITNQEMNAVLQEVTGPIVFLDGLFGDSGQLELETDHGCIQSGADDAATHVLEHVHKGAGVSRLLADEIGPRGTAGFLRENGGLAGELEHGGVADPRLASGGFRPRDAAPAAARSSHLFLPNLVKAAVRIQITGSSGAYTAAVVDLTGSGGVLYEYNVDPATLIWGASGFVFEFRDTLPAGSLAIVQVTPWEAPAGGVLLPGVATATDDGASFALLHQAAAGGAWEKILPTTTRDVGGVFVDVTIM